MRIASIVGFAPYWGTELVPSLLDAEKGPTCGGGEEAGLRTAAELKALGHDVHLWWYGQSGEWAGVPFNDLTAPLYPRLVGEHWDAIIAWSCLAPLEWAPKGAQRIFAQQLNDLSLPGDWSKVDVVVSPSLSHAQQVPLWGWRGPRAVVHNGVVPELYRDLPAWQDRPLTVGYWSSPDRGLHHLLRAWPRVLAAEPTAKLHVFYEIDRFLTNLNRCPVGYYGERGVTLARLITAAKSDPSIVFEGQQPRVKLARFQRNCRVQMYPYDTFAYCEGFGTSVAQGLVAGCTVLTTPKDAFPTLYPGAIHWINKPASDLDFSDHVADLTIAALRDELPDQALARNLGRRMIDTYSWAQAGREMERVCLGTAPWLPPSDGVTA